MTAVLRWTGVGKAVSFYRYFAFDLPVVTTLSALGLLLGFAAVQLWILFTHGGVPGYFTAYLALLAAASVCAVAGIALGWATRGARLRRGGRLAWVLGSAVSLASVAVYLFSRTAGLGGLGELRGAVGLHSGHAHHGTGGSLRGPALLGPHRTERGGTRPPSLARLTPDDCRRTTERPASKPTAPRWEYSCSNWTTPRGCGSSTG
ncbi:hypothetical protein ACFQ8O_03415 [Streptomyces coelicoflavus]|uniref:hypothetical protein n=1 Tax=Streptomyces coelicoflavus TaxID=285562 RepID=UPI0036AEC5E2